MFHLEYPDRPGPPRNLAAWVTAFDSNNETNEQLADDRPVDKSAKGKKDSTLTLLSSRAISSATGEPFTV